MAPVVSVLAEQHELQHISSVDTHFNSLTNHDTLAISDLNSNADESALHFLAHASHCCGHIAALLPNILHFIQMPTQSALDIKREHSRIDFLRISHFRPPIFL